MLDVFDLLLNMFGWLKRRNRKKKHESEKEVPILDSTDATKKLILEWKTAVETVKEHPLSQARVINDQLLGLLTKVLASMDRKLDKLDKLDSILRLLEQGKVEIEEKGFDVPEAIETAIKELERVTVKDRDAYGVLLKKGSMTANNLSKEMKISRSTASSRLNRLYDLNLVDKKAIGKKIIFVPKKLPK